jgi:uncharacterized cupredoxin-like copper-binding protein
MRLFPILIALALAAAPARAVVDDAYSTALEAAIESVKQGFKLRQEYWKGTVTGGGQKAVKHQVFKGSDVWFWLGTDTESGVKFEIEAYDSKGVKITLEKKSGKGWTAVHLKPEKTGTVVIVFKITGRDKEVIPWALVYGWK